MPNENRRNGRKEVVEINWHMKSAQSKNAMAPGGKRLADRSTRAGLRSPLETLAAPAWRLPGGMRLAEYALRGGFVASTLLARSDRER